MFQTKFLDKIKTHILCKVTFSPCQNCAVYEMMWKNIVEPDMPHDERALCAGYLRLETRSEYVILIASPMEQWLREHASVFRYT